ncbi:MAG: YfiR family protein [Verrucomicrobiales bacterium]|nr:YfiR family protein [Verrucomicrobiales bacterium]
MSKGVPIPPGLGVRRGSLRNSRFRELVPGHIPNWRAFLFCAFLLSTTPASAQISKEYQVKAVCLWRLAQFVTWPTNAFENASSPIAIGVLGENPFGDLLNAAVSGETAHGRKLVVQHYPRMSDIKSCHILFVSASEAGHVQEVLTELAGKSTLTVGDFEGFARWKGGMIAFVTQQNKVKLQINRQAATNARLELDPRLLRAAALIDDQ